MSSSEDSSHSGSTSLPEVTLIDSAQREFFSDVQKVDDYVIVKSIHVGEASRVYIASKAPASVGGQFVAVKKLPITNASCSNVDGNEDDPPDLESMFSEIAVLRRMNHPNIIKLHRVYVELESPNDLFLVLDYMPLGALMTYKLRDDQPPLFTSPLTGSVLGEALAAKCFRGILQGLSCLHAHQIAHRDIKLDNILVGIDGVCKLSDFGCCRIFNRALLSHPTATDANNARACTPAAAAAVADGATASTAAPTRTRQMVRDTAGTWLFWSPEMCSTDSEHYDVFAADVWAVGVCLWTALFGSLPFWAPSEAPLDIFERIEQRDELSLPRALNPKLETFLMNSLLSKDPLQRSTCKELLCAEWLLSFADTRCCTVTNQSNNSNTNNGCNGNSNNSNSNSNNPAIPNPNQSNSNQIHSPDKSSRERIASADSISFDPTVLKRQTQQLFSVSVLKSLIDWSLQARYRVYDRRQVLLRRLEADRLEAILTLQKLLAATATAAESSAKPASSSRSNRNSYDGLDSLTSACSNSPVPIKLVGMNKGGSSNRNRSNSRGSSRSRSYSGGGYMLRWKSDDRTKPSPSKSSCGIM